jgi:hypothetical protein
MTGGSAMRQSRLPHSQPARTDVPVCCPVCRRQVRRAARQQIYCSTRCRKRANYAKAVAEGKFLGPRYPYSGGGTDPYKKSNGNNHLQGRKSGSSKFANAPLDLLGGRWRWPGAARLDPTKRRAIIAAEIGWGP